ncbi:hypothetical protein Fcan01_22007 [Folsomia candida]|uniref:Uncharacterized protein n=1 Tax=Folsomia candida TaxID=158441 RepID=A0A226DBW1_FOLCA|nr:hypothetical protein Fcan01_22007 [Folsomia candida]
MREDCASIKWTRFGLQHVIILFETWMNIHVYIGGTLEVVHALFVGIACLLNYFEVLGRDIGLAEGVPDLKKCTEVYRSIQIMEKLFNGYLMVGIVPTLIVLMPAAQVLTQFVSIMMHSDIPMPSFLMFPLVWLNSVMTNILVFTLAS